MLNKNNILAERIGTVVPKEDGLKLKDKDGTISTLTYSEKDEITKIF